MMAVATGDTMLGTGVLEVTDCCVCGTIFAVPERLIDQRRRRAGDLHCPNGHVLTWKETDVQRVEKKLQRERELSALRAAERDQAEASLRAQKGATTRAKKRSAAGVCPCCNRTFQQLTRHMNTKHPDWTP